MIIHACLETNPIITETLKFPNILRNFLLKMQSVYQSQSPKYLPIIKRNG